MPHLWEIDHPYYAPDGYDDRVDSFAELKSIVDGYDEDMNVVYRWDWFDAAQPIHDDLFIDGEDRSKEELRVHFLKPRKAGFSTIRCPITKDQEFEVLEWLSGPRCLGYLRKLWEPVMDTLPAGEPSAREAAIWSHHVTALEVLHRTVGEQLDAARARTEVEPIETSGLSELERCAADLIYEHARDVEYSTVREMAEPHLGRPITPDEARQVHDLISRAEIVVGFPDTDR
ncbi:hypothetical protein SUDANB95_05488 [Actinosynnema sp. ALI-1.44]